MRHALLVALLALAVVGAPLHADETDSTTVSITATPGAAGVAIDGAVLFGADVWDDVWAPEGSGGATVPAQFGTDIVGAAIVSDPSKPNHLTFEIEVSDMPPTGSLPDVVIYGWEMRIDGAFIGGGTGSNLEWRRTNLTGLAASIDPYVRLRTCEQSATGGNTCSASNQLEGGFYPNENKLRATLPIGRRGLEASPGQSVTEAEIAIYHGTGVIWLPGQRSDTAWMDSDYVIPGRDDSVRLALVPAGAPTPETFPVALTPSGTGAAGSFQTVLDSTGLSGDYEVVARACWGANCGVTRVAVSL